MRPHVLLAIAISSLGSLPGQQFAAIEIPSVCSHPEKVTAGDLDGDGWLDLIVSRRIPPVGGLGIWSRHPNGTWGDRTSFGFGTIDGLVVAEVTGDDRPELLVASSDPTSTSFHILGFSTRMQPTVVAAQQWAWPMHGDLAWLRGDSDLQPDLFSFNSQAISFHRFLGNTTFAPPVTTLIATANVLSMHMADFTGDGYGDAAAVSHTPPSVSVFRGDGAGGFLPVVVTPLSLAPSGPAIVAELDGDGRSDLVVQGQPMLGTSNGTFVATGIPLPGQPRDSGDFNGDGRTDLLLHGVLYLQQPGPTFVAGPSVPFGSDHQFALDANQDGRMDIVRLFHSTIGAVKGAVLASVPPSTPPFVWPYGIGTPGCRGHVAMTANGDPTPGLASFALTATNAPAAAPGIVHVMPYIMMPVLQVPTALELRLLVPSTSTSYAVPFHANANGQAHLPLPIPANALGQTLQFQALWLAPYGDGACSESPLGLVSSNALQIQVH